MKKSFILLLLCLQPLGVQALDKYLIPGGDNVGIEIKTSGVLVVGTYNDSPLLEGDIIKKANQISVKSVNELMAQIEPTNCTTMNVTYIRDNQEKSTTINLINDDNTCKTGLYVKDTINGIGTLTFIDPDTKKFGALGHEIIESKTGRLVTTEEGTIYSSKVIDIHKSSVGTPGEKNARSDSTDVLGQIYENTKEGIFGNYTDEIDDINKVKVGEPKRGRATIKTVLEDETISEFSINITKVNNETETKNIVFEVTDVNLINKTGGIVQGMSGSPIMQEGAIVGAVTHVIIENHTKGYGINIENMLTEANN